MMTLIEQVALYLHGKGIGVYDPNVPGVSSIFLGAYPDAPDTLIWINGRGGYPAGSIALDSLSLQILNRGTADARDADAMAKRIYDALHGFHGAELVPGGDWISSIVGLGYGSIGADAKGRIEYSQNFIVAVENQTGEHRRWQS